MWCKKTGKTEGTLKMIDLAKTHCQVTTVAYSRKYRLYLVVSNEFKMFFVNEIYNLVCALDMSSIRLIKFAKFYDQEDKLVVSGIEGTFVFDFHYRGKYSPLLAVSVDSEGRYIKIDLRNQKLIEISWSKGLFLDEENKLIITWKRNSVNFSQLSSNYKVSV